MKKIIPESTLDEKTKKPVTEIFEVLEVSHHIFLIIATLKIMYRSLECCSDFTTNDSFMYFSRNMNSRLNRLSTQMRDLYEG